MGYYIWYHQVIMKADPVAGAALLQLNSQKIAAEMGIKLKENKKMNVQIKNNKRIGLKEGETK